MSDTRTYAEKRKAIRMREDLIALCNDVILSCASNLCKDCEHQGIDYPNCMGVHFADHLIANCVTVTIKKEKPPTDLSKKCGSCAYAKVEPDKFGSDYYVRCTNPEHIAKYFRNKDRSLRQRTNPACRKYKPKE